MRGCVKKGLLKGIALGLSLLLVGNSFIYGSQSWASEENLTVEYETGSVIEALQ